MKNINKLVKHTTNTMLIPLSAWILFCLWTQNYPYLASTFIGLTGSFIGLKNLISAQINIIKSKEKKRVFLPFCSRLLTFGVPIGLSLYYKNYFHFPITLLFLFSFQVIYIGLELKRHIKKYKHKKRLWTKS